MKVVFFAFLISLAVATSACAATVKLTWTSPADNGYDVSSGPVASYNLFYANNAITQADIDNYFINSTTSPLKTLTTATPKAPGTLETYSFDLPTGSEYYFALVSTDNFGNKSNISNIVNADFFAPGGVVDLKAQR